MNRERPKLLISDCKGKVRDLPSLEAAGMKAGRFFRLTPEKLVRLPCGSELFMLPGRMAVGYDSVKSRFTPLYREAFSRGKKGSFPVAAFLPPGFTATYNAAYAEAVGHRPLPLFSYAAAAFYKGEIYAACLRVDRGLRHDLRFIDIAGVKEGVAALKRAMPRNRLIPHLGGCALIYGCPNAQNLFLARYEAPLPTSPSCNAVCPGCISYQPGGRLTAAQPRIKFIPTPEEVAEVALFHIKRTADPVVSFGQGCEGEPLLAGKVLEESIRLIRARTSKGAINLNTNASRPAVIARLFDAGLDSMRVSMNSAREEYYMRYFRPKTYAFKDVMRSIAAAKRRMGFVSVNYLTMPGFTDSKDEAAALKRFIASRGIDMIQWRNLNFDPMEYFRVLGTSVEARRMIGVRELISSVKKDFPCVMTGYFNPSRRAMTRWAN